MKKNVLSRLLLALGVLTVAAVAAGCGGGGGDEADPLNVTGTWVITSSASADLTAVLTHTGTAISGTVSDANRYATRISGASTMPSGSTDDDRSVRLTVAFNDGLWVTFAGSVNDDNTSISGRYTNSQGFSDPFSAARR